MPLHMARPHTPSHTRTPMHGHTRAQVAIKVSVDGWSSQRLSAVHADSYRATRGVRAKCREEFGVGGRAGAGAALSMHQPCARAPPGRRRTCRQAPHAGLCAQC